jgi:hypothetical protein
LGNRGWNLDHVFDEEGEYWLGGRAIRELSVKCGYRIKHYRDQVLLPITMLRDERDLVAIKSRLTRFMSTWHPAVSGAFEPGTLIDTFVHELAENVLEHATGTYALVTARYLRSRWDLQAEKRTGHQSKRTAMRSPAMSAFLELYPNDGLVELIVSDTGKGITETLKKHVSEEESIFHSALQPATSQISPKQRAERSKSPLTGLGLCRYTLQRVPSLLLFSEAGGSAAFLSKAGDGGFEIQDVSHLAPLDTGTVGCNVQFALAIRAASTQGRRMTVDLDTESPDVAWHTVESPDPNAPGQTRLPLFAHDPVASGRPAMIDTSRLQPNKDTAWQLIQEVELLRREGASPVCLVGASPSLAVLLLENLRAGVEFMDPERESPQAFGTVLLTRDLYFSLVLSSDLQSQRLSEQVLENWEEPALGARLGPDVLEAAREVLGIFGLGGEQRLSPSQIVVSWLEELERRIRERLDLLGAPDNESCVLLPSGVAARQPLSVPDAFDDPAIVDLSVTSLEIIAAASTVNAVLSISEPARLLVDEFRRRTRTPVAHYHLARPLLPPSSLLGTPATTSEPCLLVLGVSNTGSYADAVADACLTVGLQVTRGLACLGFRPNEAGPKLPFRYLSLGDVESGEVVAEAREIPSMNPITLELVPATRSPQARETRRPHDGQRLYADLTRLKALQAGHFVGRYGGHFDVSINLARLIDHPARHLLLWELREQLRDATLLVALSDSHAHDLAVWFLRKLESPHLRQELDLPRPPKLITAHKTLDPDPVVRLPTTTLKAVRSYTRRRGAHILFLDDMWSTTETLEQVARCLGEAGVRQFDTTVLFNNLRPGKGQPQSISLTLGFKTANIKIRSRHLYRTFIPSFSRETCPTCRLARCLAEAAALLQHSILTPCLDRRKLALRSTDPRFTPPDLADWDDSSVSTPPLKPILGLPDALMNARLLQLAAWEATLFAGGCASLLKHLPSVPELSHRMMLLRVLAASSSRLDTFQELKELNRLLLSETGAAIDEGRLEPLLDSFFLLPIEQFRALAVSLIPRVAAAAATQESTLATFAALVVRLRREAGQDDFNTAVSSLASTITALDRDDLRRPVLAHLLRHFRDMDDPSGRPFRAWETLVTTLNPHRRIEHRIARQLLVFQGLKSQLAGLLFGGSDEGELAEYLQYFSVFQGLASIRQATKTLLSENAIERTSVTRRLIHLIEELLRLRDELHAEAASGNDHQRTLSAFKEAAVQLYGQLDSSGAQDNLFHLVQERCTPYAGFIEVLNRMLAEHHISTSLRSPEDEALRARVLLLDTWTLIQVLKSLLENIQRHHRDARPPQTGLLSATVVVQPTGDPHGLEICLANPCPRPPSAVARFLDGQDHLRLNMLLSMFGGSVSADVTSRREFLVRVRLRAY